MAKRASIRSRKNDFSDLGQDRALTNFYNKYCGLKSGDIIEINVFEHTTQGSATLIKGAADAVLNLTTNTACYLKAVDGNDIAGGTGCRGVTIFGLNKDTEGDWQYISEFVATNGIGNVALENEYCEILDAYPYSNGSGNAPAGDITIHKTSDNTKLLTIASGTLYSNGSKLIVPDGYYAVSLLITGDYVTTPGVNEAMVFTYEFTNFGPPGASPFPFREVVGANNQFKRPVLHDVQANSDSFSKILIKENHLVAQETTDFVIFIGIKKMP